MIRVRAPKEGGVTTVKAYLSVHGLPESCANSATEVAGIAPQPVIDPYDRYGDVPLSTEKERLQSAAAVLDWNAGYRILVIKRLPKIDPTASRRLQDIKRFLTETLKLSPTKYQIVTKTGPKTETEIWFAKPTTNIRALTRSN